MSRAKDKGTAAETAFVAMLRETHWPQAERLALQGANDRGDTTGHPGLTFEVKAGTRLCLPQWLRETEAERENGGSDHGILVIKPVGVGLPRVPEWWAVMRVAPMLDLLHQAGYGGRG